MDNLSISCRRTVIVEWEDSYKIGRLGGWRGGLSFSVSSHFCLGMDESTKKYGCFCFYCFIVSHSTCFFIGRVFCYLFSSSLLLTMIRIPFFIVYR